MPKANLTVVGPKIRYDFHGGEGAASSYSWRLEGVLVCLQKFNLIVLGLNLGDIQGIKGDGRIGRQYQAILVDNVESVGMSAEV